MQNLDSASVRLTFLIGGWAAIIGSLMGMVGNLFHPQTPFDDPVGTAEVISGSGGWVTLHLVIAVGIFLMLLGLFALYRSITGPVPQALAQFGLLAAVVGVAVGLLLVIMDGVAARQLTEEWASAPPAEQAIALGLVSANETVNFSVASLFNLIFAGATFIFFGLAIATGRDYPRWLGWIAVAAGVLSIGAGLVQAYNGEPTEASRLLTIIDPTVITLWLLVLGTVLIRRPGRLTQGTS